MSRFTSGVDGGDRDTSVAKDGTVNARDNAKGVMELKVDEVRHALVTMTIDA